MGGFCTTLWVGLGDDLRRPQSLDYVFYPFTAFAYLRFSPIYAFHQGSHMYKGVNLQGHPLVRLGIQFFNFLYKGVCWVNKNGWFLYTLVDWVGCRPPPTIRLRLCIYPHPTQIVTLWIGWGADLRRPQGFAYVFTHTPPKFKPCGLGGVSLFLIHKGVF